MKTLSTLLLVFFFLFSFAQTYNSPESVEYDVIHQRYIVSNTGGNNLLQVIPGSNPTNFVASGVPSPYGIAIVGDTVYVCCNSTHLRGYNLTTGVMAFDVNLGGTFLNGICTDFAGNIFVTDFTAKKVVRYNIASQQFNYFVGTAMAKTPNGIVYDPFHNRLVIATWGATASILGLSLTDSSITTLKSTTLSNIDGISIDEDGNFYGADWGSDGIYFFDSAFANAPLKAISGLSNPADISYNVLSDTVAVPNTGNNTVRFYGFLRPRPVADYDTVEVGYQKAICVLQNDSIGGGVSLQLQSFSTPQLGTASIAANCISYTATGAGNDTLHYVVCSVDTPAFCKTGTLVVTNQAAANQPPVANDDTASMVQLNSITVDVIANDVDAIGDTLCITSITGSNFFSIDSANCRNIIFSPDSSFIGNDTCLYIVCDNGAPALCDTASFIIMVTPCLPPNVQLIYLCSDNTIAPTWLCHYCGKLVLNGAINSSVSWHVSGASFDSTIINNDTLVIALSGVYTCGAPELELPYNFNWSVCATTWNFCDTVSVCKTVVTTFGEIDEISIANIHLFPNPVNNVLTIDMQKSDEDIVRTYASIEILNNLGEKQKSIQRKGNSQILSVDVSDLANGIYLATIVSDKQERRMLGKFTINR